MTRNSSERRKSGRNSRLKVRCKDNVIVNVRGMNTQNT